jgi:acetyl-CoA acetyltransferase
MPDVVIVDAVRTPLGRRQGGLAGRHPEGGALSLGHPVGGTGVISRTMARPELERSGGPQARVGMGCGGGLGTDTLIER